MGESWTDQLGNPDTTNMVKGCIRLRMFIKNQTKESGSAHSCFVESGFLGDSGVVSAFLLLFPLAELLDLSA
jgi:hypothetical protein